MPKANKRKLTDRFVQSAKPAAKRAMYWDSDVPGLALAVEPTGTKSYKYVYTFCGRSRWYTIGNDKRIALADARKEARKLAYRVEIERIDVVAERHAARKADTFEELADRYRDEYAKKRNKSWRQGDTLVRGYLLPRWGKLPAASIRRSDVRRMHADITDRGAPALANQVLAAAAAVFTWAIKQEIIDMPANPCHGVQRNPTKDRERMLSDSELPEFWRAFDKLDPMQAAALRMILLTGQRPGEVRHMRYDQIEDDDGGAWWHMPGAPDPATGWPGTKNGNSHVVWLSQPAVAILNDLGSYEGLVFTSTNGNRLSNIDAAMREACKHVGVTAPDKVTPHDLRRTHGTMVTGLGFTRDQMNRLQNHTEGGIASVYDRHHYRDEQRRIQEAVADKINTLLYGGDAKVVALR